MAPSYTPHSPSTSLSTDLTFENPMPLLSSRVTSNRARSTSRTITAGQIVTKKARKRKSRALAKPAIKELLADKLNFRDMVHQFTGQKVPSQPTSCFSSLSDISSAGAETVMSGALAQSLRAVDTISAYLLQSGASQDVVKIREEMSFLEDDRREHDGPADSVLNLLSELPANMISLELASSNYKGINKQEKVGLLAFLLLKQIVSHSKLPLSP